MIVKCINNKSKFYINGLLPITINKEYKVQYEDPNYYYVNDDNNKYQCFLKTRFEITVPEIYDISGMD